MRSFRRTALVPLILGLAIPAAAQTPKRASTTYGTTATSYIEIPSEAFMPRDSTTGYSSGLSGSTRYSTTCTGGLCFAAPLHLPSGAKIVYLELDYLDESGTDYVIGSLVRCDQVGETCDSHPAAGAGPGDCLVPGQICSGAGYGGGHNIQGADLTPDALTVDNLNDSYRLYAGTSTTGSTEEISGMIVGYVLQVSPPPGSPTFGDVPPSHPFFQFIEALAASGITGGCGGGNYCPDNPLTRGQMAVFLAKALGLQWP
jgi:hypothetical protein